MTETDHAEADSKVAVLDSASVGADETVIPQPDAGSAPSSHAELDHSTSVVSDMAEVASEGSFAAETSGAGDTMYELPKSDRTITGGERAQADGRLAAQAQLALDLPKG